MLRKLRLKQKNGFLLKKTCDKEGYKLKISAKITINIVKQERPW